MSYDEAAFGKNGKFKSAGQLLLAVGASASFWSCGFAVSNPSAAVSGVSGAAQIWMNTDTPITLNAASGTPTGCSATASSGGSITGCSCVSGVCTATFSPTSNLYGSSVGSLAFTLSRGTRTSTESATVSIDIQSGLAYGSTSFSTYATELQTAASSGSAATPSTSTINTAVGTLGNDFNYAGGVLTPLKTIIGIPNRPGSNPPPILQIDLRNGGETVSEIATSIAGFWSYKYLGGIMHSDGYVYGLPYQANGAGNFGFLKIDPSNPGGATAIAQQAGATASSVWFRGGVLSLNGSIYLAPGRSPFVGKFTPSTLTYTTVGSNLGTTVGKYYGGVLAPNGKIYFAPANQTGVLVLDPATDTTSIPAGLSSYYDYAGGALGPDGKIYFFPYCQDNVLIVDPTTNTATTETTTGLSGDMNCLKQIGGTIGPDGKIYASPAGEWRGGASTYLVINPNAAAGSKVTLYNNASGSGFAYAYMSAIGGPNGKIYVIPGQQNKVMVIDPSVNIQPNFNALLSPYYNKF